MSNFLENTYTDLNKLISINADDVRTNFLYINDVLDINLLSVVLYISSTPYFSFSCEKVINFDFICFAVVRLKLIHSI
jgi:hypothetical protein